MATGFEPVWTALQAAASPLGHATRCAVLVDRETLPRADDEIRTRDPHLGKVMRYHCATSACTPCGVRVRLYPMPRGTPNPPRLCDAPFLSGFRGAISAPSRAIDSLLAGDWRSW